MKTRKAAASDTIKRKKRKKKAAAAPGPVLIDKPPVYLRKWGNQFDKQYTDQEIERLADDMIDYFQHNTTAVYFTNFAAARQIGRQRLYEFRKSNPYFHFCFEICRDIIISRFIKQGFAGKNAAFPIFGLKNIAPDDFKDKAEIQHTGGVQIIRDSI